MRILSASDLIFIQLEKRQQPMHIGGLFLFNLPENAPENFVYQQVQVIRNSKSPVVEPFNQVLHKGLFWKKDDEFDIDHHFRHIALPKPGRIRELLVYVSQEHSSILDRAKPLWECHIIEGIEDNRFAMYFKIHHAVVDGMAAIGLVKQALSSSKDFTDSLPFWAVDSKKQPKNITGNETTKARSKNKPSRQFLSIAKKHLATIPNVSREITNNLKNIRNPLFTQPFETPATMLNQKITASRRIAAQSYDIERFRRVGQHFDMKMNDVLLAICSGVLRNYLLNLGELPKKSMTAFVPISLRTDETVSGNQIAFMLTKLATHVSDPVKRIKRINKNINENKTRFARMTQEEVINYCFLFYGPSILNLIGGFIPKRQGFNLIISNVPGSSEELYWNGAKLDALYPLSVLMDGQAMNITIASYLDKIEFGIVANTHALPHIQQMLDLIEDELQIYEGLIK